MLETTYDILYIVDRKFGSIGNSRGLVSHYS